MFNLFRRVDDTRQICVVRSGAALPPFLTRSVWTFVATTQTPDAHLDPADRETCHHALQAQGYFIGTPIADRS